MTCRLAVRGESFGFGPGCLSHRPELSVLLEQLQEGDRDRDRGPEIGESTEPGVALPAERASSCIAYMRLRSTVSLALANSTAIGR
jgi:hypothetical protein